MQHNPISQEVFWRCRSDEEYRFVGNNGAGDRQQARQEVRELSENEVSRREELKGEVYKLAQWEELSWIQKSRAHWLKEGDSNTKFFHRVANSHKRNNYIGRVEIDGIELNEGNEIKERIVGF